MTMFLFQELKECFIILKGPSKEILYLCDFAAERKDLVGHGEEEAIHHSVEQTAEEHRKGGQVKFSL